MALPSQVLKNVKKFNADIGLALDGDADRVIMCDENKDNRWRSDSSAIVKDGEKILRGGVIGTLMSNYGLEKFFKKKNKF